MLGYGYEHFAACASLPHKADPATCQTAHPHPEHFARDTPRRDTTMKKLKLKKPTGTTVALIFLSLLGITIYGSIAYGLASQFGKAPGIVHGITADD